MRAPAETDASRGAPEGAAPLGGAQAAREAGSCSGAGLWPVPRARAFLLRRAAGWAGRLAQAEELPLEGALGRVLAEGVSAPGDLPPWDVAAMDGYAVAWEALRRAGGRLPLRGRAAPGQPPGELAEGCAARIFT
ncbi:MAG: molybdopterin molybdenumtransferase MoeA, partial [Gammaproteobacteria bacterium]